MSSRATCISICIATARGRVKGWTGPPGGPRRATCGLLDRAKTGLARKSDGHDCANPPHRSTRAAHLAHRWTSGDGYRPPPDTVNYLRLERPYRPGDSGPADQRTGD